MPQALPRILFAGPSLTPHSRDLLSQTDIELRPPVSRGDIQALVDEGFSGKLIIADGFFYTTLAVRHLELRNALEAGIEVVGLSSMGAIRAYEMRHLGMEGFGRVYGYFQEWEDFQDDEVSLMHGPAPNFFPVSEPLVHIRACVEDLLARQRITKEASEDLLTEMKELFFGDRTLYLFGQLMEKYAVKDYEEIIAGFDRYRIKNRDLEDYLALASGITT